MQGEVEPAQSAGEESQEDAEQAYWASVEKEEADALAAGAEDAAASFFTRAGRGPSPSLRPPWRPARRALGDK